MRFQESSPLHRASWTARQPALILLALLTLAACDSTSSEDVSGAGDFSIDAGAVTLAATLDLPDGVGPFPVILIVPGSGQDLKESYQPLTDAVFVAHGYAVLTYDRRGTGGSTGLFEEPGSGTEGIRILKHRAADVLALVDFLTTHSDIDKIGLLSTSQGGWVAPQVAEMSPAVALIISSNGGPAPIGISDHYDSLTDDPNLSIDDAIAMLDGYDGPLGFDARPALAAMTQPGLFIYGELDRSSPGAFDASVIRDIVEATGNDFTVVTLPDTDHEMIDATTGQVSARFAPALLEWLAQKDF